MYGNGTTDGWPEAEIANETEEVVEDPELVRFRFAVHAVVVPILFASITVIGLAGNSLVVYAVSTRRRLRTVTNLLLLNLAVADLCFVTVVPPFTAYEYVAGELPRSSWALGDAVCRLLHYLVNVTAYVTVYTLTMIAAVRYATIVHSARTARWRTRRNIGRAIIGLWVVVMTVNVPILLSYSVKVNDDGEYDCNIVDWETGKRVFATLFVFAYILPLSVIGALSALILAHITQAQRSSLLLLGNRQTSSSINAGSRRRTGRFGLSTSARGHQNNDGDEDGGGTGESTRRSVRGGPRQSGRTRQVTQLLVLVVVVFALLWLPVHVHLLMAFFYHLPENSKVYLALSVLWYFLAYFNSCVNPIIYNHTSKDFRDAFVSVVGFLCRGRCGTRFDDGTDAGRNGRVVGVGGIAAAAAVIAAPVELHEAVQCLNQSQQRASTGGDGHAREADQVDGKYGHDDDEFVNEEDDSPDRRRSNLAVLGRLRPVMRCSDGERISVPVIVQFQDNGS